MVNTEEIVERTFYICLLQTALKKGLTLNPEDYLPLSQENEKRFQADKEAQGASNGGSVLAVPSASKSTEASKAFVKFVMENVDANVEGFQNYGLYPSYLKALESDVFKEGDEFFGGQQIFDLFTEVGKTVPQVNYTSNFAEALEMSKNSMANILLNDEDPAEVLKAEQEEMKAKFGK